MSVDKWNTASAILIRGSEVYASAFAKTLDTDRLGDLTETERALIEALRYDDAIPLPIGIDPTVIFDGPV